MGSGDAQGSSIGGTQESMGGAQNMWSGMDVEASGGANQGHAIFGVLRAQSDIGDSNIHIQSVTAQTKIMGDVSVSFGEITTSTTSHQVGEHSRRGRSLGVKQSGKRLFKPPKDRLKCQSQRGGGVIQTLGNQGTQSSNI